MEYLLSLLLSLPPSPAACDAIVAAWVASPADVPPLPIYLGPAIERYQTRNELWRWDHRPIWTPESVRFEIEWSRCNLVDYPPLSEADRLPTETELDRADAILMTVDCWLTNLAPVASPMEGPRIVDLQEEIRWRRSLLSIMRNARGPSQPLYRRRALDEIRTLCGPRAWLTGEWPIGVP